LAFTRRRLLHGGALIAATPAIKVLTGASPIEAAHAAATPADLKWRHGLSLFGDVKYPEGFKTIKPYLRVVAQPKEAAKGSNA